MGNFPPFPFCLVLADNRGNGINHLRDVVLITLFQFVEILRFRFCPLITPTLLCYLEFSICITDKELTEGFEILMEEITLPTAKLIHISMVVFYIINEQFARFGGNQFTEPCIIMVEIPLYLSSAFANKITIKVFLMKVIGIRFSE